MDFVRYEKTGHLAVVTIDRPEVMNALHPPANRELAAVWDDFAADDELWVAVVTGSGEKAFCAGNDLKYSAAHGMEDTVLPPSGFGGLTSRFDLFKPVIAAVNGLALGGGFEIALACDIVIAAQHARFGLPEPRVGLAALAGGVHRLPRQIPQKIAFGMMLTGVPIDAAEARALGLVNECVPVGELMAAARRWADGILACSPVSVRATKQAAMLGLGRPLDEAMSQRHSLTAALFRSEDMKEGIAAFAQKRAPAWKGK